MPAIHANKLTKTYPCQGAGRALLGRNGIGRLLKPLPPTPCALGPIDLSVASGEALGIIGRNGSGKSTLLKIIAGVTAPTTGSIEVNGRVASLLELGTGFHPMLTGRENVYLNAGLLGMRHAQVEACFEQIVDFAELDGYMDRTVDTYSSGMFVRLAFSVAIHTNPDIFLVDEVLSVGDESFQRKCRARILELKAAGKTILFVSHDLGTVQNLCDRVVLLEDGTELSRGNARDTIEYYLRHVGTSGGVRRLLHEETEVLFNNGRVSLFVDQRELTAPMGIKVQFFSQGAYHESTSALWNVEEADGTLSATGEFPRLPVRLYMRLSLGTDGLAINVSWENTRAFDAAYVALQCFLPTTYDRWQADDKSGECPPIGAEHHQWSTLLPARPNVRQCELTTAGDAHVPDLCFSVDACNGQSGIQIDNADYMTQARIVHVTESIPTGENPLSPGVRSFVQLRIDPILEAEALAEIQRKRQESRRIVSGSLDAELRDGFALLKTHDKLLSDFLHLHVQLRVGDLWLLSHDFLWDGPEMKPGQRTATGRSQRLPCSVSWTLRADEGNRLQVHISLEASRAFELAEYNVSLCLSPTFKAWRTDTESGEFSSQSAGNSEWTHCNRNYDAGNKIEGIDAGGNAIALASEAMLGPVFPTAIRTGKQHDGRVLQLLCRPNRVPAFAIEEGTHTLFDGYVAWDTGATS